MVSNSPAVANPWTRVRTERCDVAVVGSGAAGMNAAIHAAMAGATTLIIDKGAIGRSGASIQANVIASAAPEGGYDAHVRDIVRTGAGLADQNLAEVLAREAPDRFREWLEWGVRFHVDASGDFVRTKTAGHSQARSISPGYGMGEKACRALRKWLIKSPDVRGLPYTSAVELLLDDGEVRGLVAWDFQAGEWVVIDAPSVVIATGGAQQLYRANTAAATLTGDGFALARLAGAALVGLEFVLYVPVSLVSPRPIATSRAILETLRKVAGQIVDRDGRRFVHEYTPEGEQAPWEVVSRAIQLALRAGRGTDRGTVVYRANAEEQARLVAAYPAIIDKLPGLGIDLAVGAEVTPMAHFFPGGIRIDAHAESDIPGLFAAGEAAGGVHGATRLTGDAFAAAAVFGARAGRFGADRARVIGPRGGRDLLRAGHDVVDRRLTMRTTSAPSPDARMRAVQDVVADAFGPVRTPSGMRHADEALAGLATETSVQGDDPRGNRSFTRFLEAYNLQLAGRALAEAARARPESKGAHFVVDDDTVQPVLVEQRR
ncbi:MAG: FAD-binding protein [Nitriliruptoraceae bacterium]